MVILKGISQLVQLSVKPQMLEIARPYKADQPFVILDDANITTNINMKPVSRFREKVI